MSDGKLSPVDWLAKNMRQGKRESTVPPPLTECQQAIVDAMSEPGVEVRYLTHREMTGRMRIERWHLAFGDPDQRVLLVEPEERPATKADLPKAGSFWSA